MERRKNILPTPAERFLVIPSARPTRVVPGGTLNKTQPFRSQHSVANWKNSLILGLPVRTLMLCQSQKPPNIQWILPLKNTYRRQKASSCLLRKTHKPSQTLFSSTNPSSSWRGLPGNVPIPPKALCCQGHHSEKLCCLHTSPKARMADARTPGFLPSLGWTADVSQRG